MKVVMLISRLRRELFLSGGSMVRSRYVSVGEQVTVWEGPMVEKESRSGTLSLVCQPSSFMYILCRFHLTLIEILCLSICII